MQKRNKIDCTSVKVYTTFSTVCILGMLSTYINVQPVSDRYNVLASHQQARGHPSQTSTEYLPQPRWWYSTVVALRQLGREFDSDLRLMFVTNMSSRSVDGNFWISVERIYIPFHFSLKSNTWVHEYIKSWTSGSIPMQVKLLFTSEFEWTMLTPEHKEW